MYQYRPLQSSDLETLCTFPQNEEELFFMFPKAKYPLTPDQIWEVARNRLEPTVILIDQEIVSYANFYDHDGEFCWLGNVIVSPDYRGKGVSQYLIGVMETIAKQKLKVKKLNLVCHNTNTKG